jgi:P pilus assembly chaperone PapD
LALSANGSSLSVSNPTPFYITVSRISRNGGKALSKTVMFAPQSSQTIASLSGEQRRDPDR